MQVTTPATNSSPPEVTLRPLTRADFPLLSRWLQTPHVQQWWQDYRDLEDHYGPSLDDKDSTRLYIALAGDTPIGFFQAYTLEEYPDLAKSLNLQGGIGVDLYIGEPKFLHQGYGPAMLRAFVETVLPTEFPSAPGIIADPNRANTASIRAFEKAGFHPVESSDESIRLMMLRLSS